MLIIYSLESVFTIIIIIAIGYYLTSKNWFDEQTSKSFAKLVTNVSLPAYMLFNLIDNFTKNKLENFAKEVWIPFLSIGICYILSVIMSHILNIEKKRRGTFQSMFFNSNTIFIGLPINMALFGEKSIPYVLLYYIANTTFFWTLGVYCISKDAYQENRGKIKTIDSFKKIISPPFLGFIVAVIFILLNVTLPKFIMDTCKYLGDLTTPLSMIFIGISIYYVKLKNIKFNKDVIGVLLGRFIISPVIIFLIVCFLPIPSIMKKVFIIQSSMPVMTNTSIIAKAYGADNAYAAVMTTLTTVLSMITIPVLMALMHNI